MLARISIALPNLRNAWGSANTIDSDGASLYCPTVYVAQASNNAHGTGPPHVADSREFVDTPGDRKAVISPRCGLRRSSGIDSKFRIPANSKWEAHGELSPPARARFAAIRGGRRATHPARKCRGRMAADLPGRVENEQRAGSAGSAGGVSVPAGGQRCQQPY